VYSEAYTSRRWTVSSITPIGQEQRLATVVGSEGNELRTMAGEVLRSE